MEYIFSGIGMLLAAFLIAPFIVVVTNNNRTLTLIGTILAAILAVVTGIAYAYDVNFMSSFGRYAFFYSILTGYWLGEEFEQEYETGRYKAKATYNSWTDKFKVTFTKETLGGPFAHALGAIVMAAISLYIDRNILPGFVFFFPLIAAIGAICKCTKLNKKIIFPIGGVALLVIGIFGYINSPMRESPSPASSGAKSDNSISTSKTSSVASSRPDISFDSETQEKINNFKKSFTLTELETLLDAGIKRDCFSKHESSFVNEYSIWEDGAYYVFRVYDGKGIEEIAKRWPNEFLEVKEIAGEVYEFATQMDATKDAYNLDFETYYEINGDGLYYEEPNYTKRATYQSYEESAPHPSKYTIYDNLFQYDSTLDFAFDRSEVVITVRDHDLYASVTFPYTVTSEGIDLGTYTKIERNNGYVYDFSYIPNYKKITYDWTALPYMW